MLGFAKSRGKAKLLPEIKPQIFYRSLRLPFGNPSMLLVIRLYVPSMPSKRTYAGKQFFCGGKICLLLLKSQAGCVILNDIKILLLE
jgi:hypothetical protein